MKTRRSIRHYKPDPVANEDIEKIIEAARWAPSGFNSQLWEFVVVKDSGLKARIGEVVGTAFSDIVKQMPPAVLFAEKDATCSYEVGFSPSAIGVLAESDQQRDRPVAD
mgnify:CR=1 FL=1